jgi:hypothetical protein
MKYLALAIELQRCYTFKFYFLVNIGPFTRLRKLWTVMFVLSTDPFYLRQTSRRQEGPVDLGALNSS